MDSSSPSIEPLLDTDVKVATHHTNKGFTEGAMRVDAKIIQLEQEYRVSCMQKISD